MARDMKLRAVLDAKPYRFSNFYNDYAAAMRSGDLERAELLAAQYLEASDDPNCWMIYGQIMMAMARPLPARAAFRAGFLKAALPHISDVIHAGVRYTIAIVDDLRKVLYVPIPKCGSTTVKGYLTSVIFNRASDLDAHDGLAGMHRLIDLADMATRYADYFRFSIVRPFADRIISYHSGNITTGMMQANSWGLEQLSGLPTRPTIEMFLDRYDEYRQTFLDVRHHTDPLSGFLGEPTHYDAIYTMDKIADVRSAIQDIYGQNVPEARKTRSPARTELGTDILGRISQFSPDETDYFKPLSHLHALVSRTVS